MQSVRVPPGSMSYIQDRAEVAVERCRQFFEYPPEHGMRGFDRYYDQHILVPKKFQRFSSHHSSPWRGERPGNQCYEVSDNH